MASLTQWGKEAVTDVVAVPGFAFVDFSDVPVQCQAVGGDEREPFYTVGGNAN